MNWKNMATLFQICIVIIMLLGLGMCLLCYPFFVSLYSILYPNLKEVTLNSIAWGLLTFLWSTSVPCFFILFKLWKISGNIKKERIFFNENLIELRKILKILCIDSIFFIIGHTFFAILGWNPFALFGYIMGVIGLVLSAIIYLLLNILKMAVELKEENESIISTVLECQPGDILEKI